jgi:hypothetical protein
MSRAQEALSLKDYVCAKPEYTVTETRRRSEKRDETKPAGELEYRHSHRGALRIVPSGVNTNDGSAPAETSKPDASKQQRKSAWRKYQRSAGKRPVIHLYQSAVEESRPTERESLAAQISRFQARADLRQCLLPGMVSGVTAQACEGWQRQASIRTSRLMAKLKLEPCKECPYALESCHQAG